MISSRFGTTSLFQNSSAARAIARCSSVRSSGVKISCGVRSSSRNAQPFVFGTVTAAVAISVFLYSLENARGALAAADAHYHHSVHRLAAGHLTEDASRQLGPRASP